MMKMSSRSDRKKYEREQDRKNRKENFKKRMTDRIEEFKLNREGKTKKKRTDVMGRYRRTNKTLNALIFITLLLLVIAWVIVLYY